MSESAAFVAGGGGFVRVRDNVGGYQSEFNRQKQLDAERQRQKQLEQDRRDAFREVERQKKLKDNEAKAAEAFRDFHDPRKRGETVANCMKYSDARGYHRQNYRLANAELLNPEFIQYFHPTKYAQMEHAKADAATLDHVIRCEKCGLITNRGCLCGCFQLGKQYGTLTVTEVNGGSCTARCSCGRSGPVTQRELEDGTVVCMECEKEKD